MDHVTDTIDLFDSLRPWSPQDQADVATLNKALRVFSRGISGLAVANAITFRRLQREAVLSRSDLPSPVKQQCRETVIQPSLMFSEEADRKVQDYKVSPASFPQTALQFKRPASSQAAAGNRKRPRFAEGTSKKRSPSTKFRNFSRSQRNRRSKAGDKSNKQTHSESSTSAPAQQGQRS